MDTGVTEGHTSKELVLSIINLILMNDGENFIGLLSNYLSVFFNKCSVCWKYNALFNTYFYGISEF